jgi:hypothetical protein
MGLRELFGIKAADTRPQLAGQPFTSGDGEPGGHYSPARGTGWEPPWMLGTVTPYWTSAEGNDGMIPSPNQGVAGNYEAPVSGPGGQPHPTTDPNYLHRVGNGYPGILPDQSYDSCINDGPAPNSYRRFLDCRLMDTTPNRVGGGSSGGNDNDVVMWSLAGQLYGRPPGAIVSQPQDNQVQGVTAVPSVFARRTVG